jgi:LmbE family N-acetylglucosaminyl deacetylase
MRLRDTDGAGHATRGEEGEVVDPDMNPDEVKPKLGDVRTAELECACKHLEVEELHILGYRDSGMIGWKPIIILTAWPRQTSTRPQDAWCTSSEPSVRMSLPAMMSKGAMVTLTTFRYTA